MLVESVMTRAAVTTEPVRSVAFGPAGLDQAKMAHQCQVLRDVAESLAGQRFR